MSVMVLSVIASVLVVTPMSVVVTSSPEVTTMLIVMRTSLISTALVVSSRLLRTTLKSTVEIVVMTELVRHTIGLLQGRKHVVLGILSSE